MAAFQFEVVTPERTVVHQDVEYVSLPGMDGQFGVLANHAPLAAVLEIGVVEFGARQGERDFLALGGRFAEMHGNVLTVMGKHSRAGPRDRWSGRKQQSRAEERLAQRSEKWIARAEASLRRAMARLKVANFRGNRK